MTISILHRTNYQNDIPRLRNRVPMKGGGVKSFYKNIKKGVKKGIKALPDAISKYDNVKSQIEAGYDKYKDMQEQLPDFVKDNAKFQQATSMIEKGADRGRALRDNIDTNIEKTQPYLSKPQAGEGHGALALKKRLIKMERARKGKVGKGLKLAGVAPYPSKGGSLKIAGRGHILKEAMSVIGLPKADQQVCVQYCMKHPTMSKGQTLTLPLKMKCQHPTEKQKAIIHDMEKLVGSGKKADKLLKTVGDVANIITPFLALL